MINVVIGFDKEQGMYKVYEPTTDTLLITSSLSESFIKLSEFLNQKGMIPGDILGSDCIQYHIDSSTFLAMIESNVALLKRLNTAPSGFMISGQRFGQSSTQSSPSNKSWDGGKSKRKKIGGGGTFSKSGFKNSYKKFGGNENWS